MVYRLLLLPLLQIEDANVVIDLIERQNRGKPVKACEGLVGLAQSVFRHADAEGGLLEARVLLIYFVEQIQSFFIVAVFISYAAQLKNRSGILTPGLLGILF